MSLTDIIKSVKKSAKAAAFALGLGALALLPIQKADASMMGIETKPIYQYWVRDGTTQYELQVRADSTSTISPNDKIYSSKWALSMPAELVSYLNLTGVSLPLPQETQNGHPIGRSDKDFYESKEMNAGVGRDYINNIFTNRVSGLSLRQCFSASDGAQNRDFDKGLEGSYFFTLNSNAPLKNSQFGLSNIYFYATTYSGGSVGKYSSSTGVSTSTCTVTNNPIRIVDPIFIDKPQLGINPDYGGYPKDPDDTPIKTSDIKFKLVGTEAEMFGPSGINKNFVVEILADYNGTPENLADDVLVNGDHTLENIMVNFSVNPSEKGDFFNSSTGMYELPMVITSTISNNKNLDPNSIVFVGGLEFYLVEAKCQTGPNGKYANVYAKISDVSEELSPANSDMVYLYLSPDASTFSLLGAGATGAAAMMAMRRKRNMEKDKHGARRNPYDL